MGVPQKTCPHRKDTIFRGVPQKRARHISRDQPWGFELGSTASGGSGRPSLCARRLLGQSQLDWNRYSGPLPGMVLWFLCVCRIVSFACFFICLPVCQTFCPCVCPSVRPFVRLSVCLSVCLLVCLCISVLSSDVVGCLGSLVLGVA